jgi:hypothetical protein
MLGTYGWFLGSPEYDVKFVICQIEFRELIISLIAGGCRCCVIGLLVHKAITFCIFEMLSGIGTKCRYIFSSNLNIDLLRYERLVNFILKKIDSSNLECDQYIQV